MRKRHQLGIRYDSVNNSLWFQKILGKFTKCGKMEILFFKLVRVLKLYKRVTEVPILLLYEVLELLKPQIFLKWKIKNMRKHKQVYYQVPYPISEIRQYRIAIK